MVVLGERGCFMKNVLFQYHFGIIEPLGSTKVYCDKIINYSFKLKYQQEIMFRPDSNSFLLYPPYFLVVVKSLIQMECPIYQVCIM